MPTVEVSKIIERARIKTDNVDSEFMSDDECLLLLNDLRMSLYTQLYTKCDETLFLEEAELDLTDGDVTLPSDVFQIRKIEGKLGGNTYYNLQPRSLTEASDSDNGDAVLGIAAPTNSYYYIIKGVLKVRPSASVSTVKILYNPIPTPINAVTDAVDIVFHEDRWLVASLAIDIANKEESDPSPFFIERNEVFLEITQSYKRDNSYPKKIIDVNKRYPGKGLSRGRRRW